ncbi:hypothetical protein ABE10_12340 [Bacillus toyonensis]|nr:hypothetical protein [Bacillus toyonensis]
MTMRDTRSPSQVLFSHLPAQTTDIKSRIWKVQTWLNPLTLRVDTDGVRQRLLSAIDPWRAQGNDNGLSNQLHQGKTIEVVGVNPEQGVKVDAWPNVWRCQSCRRVTNSKGQCACGNKTWAQLHFVGFHECGYLGEPFVPKCPEHNQVLVKHSSSSSVRDLEFECPICHRALQKGLGAGRPCPGCKQPGLTFNVHRAASVYTPHTFTMVNPARPEHLQALLADGGREKSLRWVLSEMQTARPEKLAPTRQSMIDSFVQQGLPLAAAEAAVQAAIDAGAGHLDEPVHLLDISPLRQEEAEATALEVALATYEGRRTASQLPGDPVGANLRAIYEDKYAPAIHRAGLVDVDHVDRFPILRGVFGYTRGGKPVGESRLVAYQGRQQSIRVYADTNETEALYLRLDPVRVAAWLHRSGLLKEAPTDPSKARIAIINAAEFPGRGDDVPVQTPGSAVLTLLHTYAHRFIRQLAVLAGVDRESLAEYLVPQHLGVFIYATPRGQFVLGGLQSVFETDLDRLLDLQVDAETRCPLDPGCDRSTGACLACLLIGEPSCSHYNKFLDRKTLFGSNGYLRKELS